MTDAMVGLGYLYERGKGVKKDVLQAEKWYRQALEHGEEGAEWLLQRKKFVKALQRIKDRR